MSVSNAKNHLAKGYEIQLADTARDTRTTVIQTVPTFDHTSGQHRQKLRFDATQPI